MQIMIPDDYQDAVRSLSCFANLAGHEVTIFRDTLKDVDALAERFAYADALVLIRERTPITDALLAKLPRLKLVSQTGKGTAHIDVAACRARGIVVSAGTGSPYAPAELTWALVLAAMRRIPQETARLRAGGWQSTVGTLLRGRTLGVWGYGKIGSIVAGYGRTFGMRVIVRGFLECAGRPGFAAVDVYEEEPILGAAHPLLALENAVCTPHLGYVERDSYELYFAQAFDQVLAFAAGTPINVVA